MAHVTAPLNRAYFTEAAPPAAAKPAAPSASAAAPDFRALLARSTPPSAPATAPAATQPPAALSAPAAPAAAPTPQSVFGADPWLADPQGWNPDGSQFSYNPIYFATASTAAQVAQMLGGTVAESNALAPNAQQEPNYMVDMPDGRSINAGLVASFYSHGYPQSYVDGLIAGEINGTNT